MWTVFKIGCKPIYILLFILSRLPILSLLSLRLALSSYFTPSLQTLASIFHDSSPSLPLNFPSNRSEKELSETLRALLKLTFVMAASTTSQVYIDVIEDVMVKVRDEFVNNGGPGEEVLKELQAVINYNLYIHLLFS